jgi:hypothetical protein
MSKTAQIIHFLALEAERHEIERINPTFCYFHLYAQKGKFSDYLKKM